MQTLPFTLQNVRAKKLPLSNFSAIVNGKTFPQLLLPFIKVATEDAKAKCDCFQLKKPKLWENKAPFITLTKNYVHVLIKQKKTKTECLRGLLVFVLKLGPFEKPFHKLGLLVSSGFLNTWKQFSCVWKPSWNTRSRLWNTTSLYISKKPARHQIGWAPKVFETNYFLTTTPY